MSFEVAYIKREIRCYLKSVKQATVGEIINNLPEKWRPFERYSDPKNFNHNLLADASHEVFKQALVELYKSGTIKTVPDLRAISSLDYIDIVVVFNE